MDKVQSYLKRQQSFIIYFQNKILLEKGPIKNVSIIILSIVFLGEKTCFLHIKKRIVFVFASYSYFVVYLKWENMIGNLLSQRVVKHLG